MKSNLTIKILFAALALMFSNLSIAQQLNHVLDEALVQLEHDTDLDAFSRSIQTFEGINTKSRIGRHISRQMNVYVVHFDNNVVNEHEFRDFIGRQSGVLVAQVNHILQQRETIPDDPFFEDQWHWDNDGQSGGTADADIDMDLAWDITTGGTTANGDEIVVAVFDDGGDLDHPDLIDNNWINPHEIDGNGVDDDNNGYVDDVYGWNYAGNNNNVDNGGHGVNVAGMIGAVGNNGNQGTGVNWNVKIMNNRTGGIQEAQVIEFYSYALDQRRRYNQTNGAEGSFVVATNSSWGIDGGNPDNAPLWCAFYDSLGVEGILSCGATANNNVNIDVVGDLPTACPSEYMVAVTATNDSDNRTFSGYGATTIDVGAPGAQIYTTASNGGYTFTSGTSFASPTTAGVIALLYAAPCANIANLALSDPALAAQQVRDYLYEGTELVGNLEGDVVHGRINAFNSLELIMANCGPCPPPAGLNVTDLIDVQGNLVWNNPPDGQSNTLRYREIGAADWTEVSNVASPYTLTGLTACTPYEFQVEAMCTDTLSGYSNSFEFQTDGCCEAPGGFAIVSADSTSATAEWSSVFAAQSYNIRIRMIGAADWTEFNTTNLNYTFSDLMICTDYEVQVQTVCMGMMTDYTESIIFSTFGCGACIDLTYCESMGENVDDEWIASVSIGSFLNESFDQPASGYTDFTGTNITTTFETYATYDVSLLMEYSGQTFDEYFKIWIDYNQNGVFNDPTELAFDAGVLVEDEPATGIITIPADALTGLTRMRVSMKYNAAQTPCETFMWGEVEDYCITIAEGEPICEVPDGLTASSITENSATLNWTAVGIADSYTINYRAMGAANWEETTSNTTFVDIDGLLDCTTYEYRVSAVCGADNSDFSETATFLTICACPIPLGLDTSDVSTTGATLLWDASDNSESYDMRYKATITATWITQNVNATNFALTNLTDCTDYEFQVRSVCTNSESAWSDSFTFATACISSTFDVENGVEALRIFPNPFKQDLSVQFELNERTDLNIVLYNAIGQMLSTQSTILGSGEHNVTISDLNNQSQGVYFIAFTTDRGTKVRRVIKQ